MTLYLCEFQATEAQLLKVLEKVLVDLGKLDPEMAAKARKLISVHLQS